MDNQENPIEFANYGDARDPLIARIGEFCSYCEVALHSSVHVEHVCPKSRRPDLENEWSNFLLACDYCNPIKGDTDVVLNDYYWPDRDNTARAFVYLLDQPPRWADGLTDDERIIVQSTIELTGLDRVPGHKNYSDRDRRWIKRREAWGIALQARRNLNEADTPQLRNSIVFTAMSRGFWSVWMEVFHDDQDMRTRFLNSFPGTALDCFDEQTNAIPRPGGRI